MPGAEYLTAGVLTALWAAIGEAFSTELAEARTTVQDFLKRQNPAWNLVGRVHFNLAENRQDEEAPFAFLATYTDRLSAHGKAQHLPLGQALREYAGAANKGGCSRCCCRCSAPPSTVRGCGRWSTRARSSTRCAGRRPEAFRLLARRAGARARRRHRSHARGLAGRAPAATAGHGHGRLRRRPPRSVRTRCSTSAWSVTLDGEPLTPAEVQAAPGGHERACAHSRPAGSRSTASGSSGCCERFQEAERLAAEDGLTFAEAMRLLAAADVSGTTAASGCGSGLVARRRRAVARRIARSAALARRSSRRSTPAGELRAHAAALPAGRRALAAPAVAARTGRVPRRRHGARQDHPGAGAAARAAAGRRDGERRPSLLVAPASLLANWAAEIERFAPGLRDAGRASLGHAGRGARSRSHPAKLADVDLVITSYGSLLRVPWLAATAVAISRSSTRRRRSRTRTPKQTRARQEARRRARASR